MRVLVTGATGFLGSHVVEALLAAGHDVRALARPSSDVRFIQTTGATIVHGDLDDASSLRAAAESCDGVIHTAAVVGEWQPWSEFFRVGVQGTRRLLDAAQAAHVPRFVHVSSIAVYGSRLHGRVLREHDPYDYRPEPWNHYVREKVQSEKLAFQYYERAELEVVAIRPSVIWGKRDRAALPRTLDLLRSPVAALIGKGRNRIPSVSAIDVADACVRALTIPLAAGRAYNISSARTYSQQELMVELARGSGIASPTRHVPFAMAMGLAAAQEAAGRLLRRSAPPAATRFNLLIAASDTLVDSSLAREELGWSESQSVADAISEAVAALT